MAGKYMNDKDPPCLHSFRHLETRQWFEASSYGCYYRIDEFFCKRCLLRKTVQRRKPNQPGTSHEIKPEWFR